MTDPKLEIIEFFEDDYSEQYKKYDKNESHIINPFSLGTFRLYNAHDCHTTAIRHTILKHIPQKRLLCKSIVTSENKIFYEELKLNINQIPLKNDIPVGTVFIIDYINKNSFPIYISSYHFHNTKYNIREYADYFDKLCILGSTKSLKIEAEVIEGYGYENALFNSCCKFGQKIINNELIDDAHITEYNDYECFFQSNGTIPVKELFKMAIQHIINKLEEYKVIIENKKNENNKLFTIENENSLFIVNFYNETYTISNLIKRALYEHAEDKKIIIPFIDNKVNSDNRTCEFIVSYSNHETIIKLLIEAIDKYIKIYEKFLKQIK